MNIVAMNVMVPLSLREALATEAKRRYISMGVYVRQVLESRLAGSALPMADVVTVGPAREPKAQLLVRLPAREVAALKAAAKEQLSAVSPFVRAALVEAARWTGGREK